MCWLTISFHACTQTHFFKIFFKMIGVIKGDMLNAAYKVKQKIPSRNL